MTFRAPDRNDVAPAPAAPGPAEARGEHVKHVKHVKHAAKHVLVLGKFYPPHYGHDALILAALAGARRVTVLVLAHPDERLPLALRVEWLREMHPTAEILGAVDPHPVDYDDPRVWDLHMEVFHQALGGRRIDTVVTSEAYGDELARRLGARHVAFDPERARVPISGTALRNDLAAGWAWLAPAVRAHFARRVCVVGAESTGKTTLAADLARAWSTCWVPEYGRAYTEEKIAAGTVEHWRAADFTAIAGAQVALENAAARHCGPVLFADTDALATCIWEERYLGTADPMTERIAAEARRPDLYLLTLPDVPWVADGVRDGDEALRQRMTEQFRLRIGRLGVPVVEIAGPFPDRFATAHAAVAELLTRFAPFA